MCIGRMAERTPGARGIRPCTPFFRSSGDVPQWRCRHAASGRANAAARMCGLPCEVRIATSASLALHCHRAKCVGVLSLPPRAEFPPAGSLRPHACFPQARPKNDSPPGGPKFAPQSVRADCWPSPFWRPFLGHKMAPFLGPAFFRALPEPSSCDRIFFSVASSVQLPSSRPALAPRAELRARADCGRTHA